MKIILINNKKVKKQSSQNLFAHIKQVSLKKLQMPPSLIKNIITSFNDFKPIYIITVFPRWINNYMFCDR